MMTMFVAPRTTEIEYLLKRVSKGTSIKLLISGNPINFENETKSDNIIYLNNPDEFITHLDKI